MRNRKYYYWCSTEDTRPPLDHVVYATDAETAKKTFRDMYISL